MPRTDGCIKIAVGVIPRANQRTRPHSETNSQPPCCALCAAAARWQVNVACSMLDSLATRRKEHSKSRRDASKGGNAYGVVA